MAKSKKVHAIKVTKNFKGSPDGAATVEYQAGHTYQVVDTIEPGQKNLHELMTQSIAGHARVNKFGTVVPGKGPEGNGKSGDRDTKAAGSSPENKAEKAAPENKGLLQKGLDAVTGKGKAQTDETPAG